MSEHDVLELDGKWGSCSATTADILRIAEYAARSVLSPWFDGKDTGQETVDLRLFVTKVLEIGVESGINPEQVIDVAELVEVPWS